MIQPRFNLKDHSAVNETLIHLILNYDGKRFKMSTGQSIPPKFWNLKTDRVRETQEFSNYNKINEDLDKQEHVLKTAYAFFDSQSISPTPDALKKKFNEILLNPKKLNNSKSCWDFFDEFVEYQRGRINPRSVLDYDKALRKHLKETENRYGIPLSFNSLRSSGNFIDKMSIYLTKHALNSEGGKGFSLNAKGKQMKNIKSFLNWCFMKEYCPIFSLKHIIKTSEEVDNIYLTYDEIETIFNLEISDKHLAKVRDLFIVGCETGLRFSDFARLKPEHIASDKITIYQKKVKAKVVIPVSKKLKSILEKYNSQLPQFKDQDLTGFNEKIRDIGKLANINENIVIKRTRGSDTKELFFPKYELMSSHTCRRSFCTNKFKKGVPVKVIMAISGHATEKAFMKYLKLSPEQIIESYAHLFD